MPTKGHTSIIMLMYAPCWLRPLKPAVNGRLRHVYKTTGTYILASSMHPPIKW